MPVLDSKPKRGRVPALVLSLAVLAVARIAIGLVPSMAMWGLNVQRFVPLAPAVTLLALPLLALVPAIARPLASWLDRCRFERRPWRIAFVVGAMLFVVALPDRVWFSGDFIGRQFSLNAEGSGLAWYTHSMPLDTAIHEQLGRLLLRGFTLAPNAFGRIVGAVEAGALAWIAMSFAIEAGLAGAAAIAAAALVFWGGWLTLFTGYNKAISDLVVLVALFAVFGLRVIRTSRGLLPLAGTLALALLVHRSALALTPAFAVVWVVAMRRTAADGRRWDPRLIAAVGIPALLLAVEVPHLLATLHTYDRALFVPIGAHAATPDTRLLDVLNLFLFFTPVCVAMLPVCVASMTRTWRGAETVFFVALMVPFFVIAAWFYPPEGLFRMGDIFAPAGIALALAGAWLLAGIVEATPRSRWMNVAVLVATTCPALLALLHDTNTEFGQQRVRAYLNEPPARAPETRASAYEFLGFRLIDFERPSEAAEAFAHAADVVPSPRVLRQWAVAETMAGDPVAAQSVMRRIVDRDPDNRSAWEALAAQAIQNGDSAEAVHALEAIVRLAPGDARARELLRRIAVDRGAP